MISTISRALSRAGDCLPARKFCVFQIPSEELPHRLLSRRELRSSKCSGVSLYFLNFFSRSVTSLAMCDLEVLSMLLSLLGRCSSIMLSTWIQFDCVTYAGSHELPNCQTAKLYFRLPLACIEEIQLREQDRI